MAILVALAMPVLAGGMGLAAETSYWYVHQRGMQNAADAAAIAAATNADSTNANSPVYRAEAKAVAAQYGFTDGSGNITVTATSPTGCTANCLYTVTVSDKVPLFLSQVLGFRGTTKIGNKDATLLAATSAAKSGGAYPYCILALSGSVTQDIISNGAPKTDLHGCNVMSNTGATCHGHNLNANVGDAHGSNNGCGIIQNSNVPTVADPYSGLASNIPADTCGGSYPQEPAKKKDPPLPASNQWSGAKTLSENDVVCGDQQLTGDTTISAPSNAVLVIENGQLDTNGFTLKTTSGSGLTIVFTGSSGFPHVPSGGGTLDITAPTSGPWSGIAMYQDPNLTNHADIDVSAAGNSPTWNITGMVYLPKSFVTFSGAVSKSSNASNGKANCFGMTVGDITINGTGSIFANDTECSAAGLALPMGGHRGTLVN